MADHNEILSQFTAITGANEERARFFLESSAWKLDMAMARYYENEGEDVEEVAEQPAEPNPIAPMPKPSPKKPSVATSNIATLNTLATSSDEDDEEGQAFYAGGSEHSGQQVLGPSKKKDIVGGMFKSVQEHGVEILEPGASGSSKIFRGTGYKLGQSSDDSVVIPAASEAPTPPEVTLKLWRDGYSVNDGELREYTDPANKEFLRSIQRGEIPQELRQGTNEVHLSMEDHRMESFKKSEHRVTKPFTGQGYTLGSPAPPVVGATGEEDKPANEARAKEALNLDSSQPVTNLQIRLSDGSRLVAQFNHTHTVGHIRSYILAARPQYEMREFNLLANYPSKILEDSQTLVDAGLLNSAIMQKLI